MQSSASKALHYGSASLTGFMWKDYSCLQRLDHAADSQQLFNSSVINRVTNHEDAEYTQDKENQFLAASYKFNNENKCSYFPFLALYSGEGLGSDVDGILGLAPQKSVTDRQDNFVWSLFNSGIISKPILSMSVSSGDIEDDTYALFGGYNSTQIVGGEYGLATFRNNHYDYKSAVKSWALPSRDLLYGGESVGYNKQTVEYPAIIDTGSSFLAVPGDEFTALS